MSLLLLFNCPLLSQTPTLALSFFASAAPAPVMFVMGAPDTPAVRAPLPPEPPDVIHIGTTSSKRVPIL